MERKIIRILFQMLMGSKYSDQTWPLEKNHDTMSQMLELLRKKKDIITKAT